MSDFVHLHVHSHYSLLDGAARIHRLVDCAAEQAMPALALTDHGVMIGAVEFYQKATAAGLRPILGMEAYLAPGRRDDRRPTAQGGGATSHLTLLARDNRGYQNLMRLSSLGFLEGFYYRPRIDVEALAAHAEGLIALSGCPSGEIPRQLARGNLAAAEAIARRHREIFGPDNFYLEVMRHGQDREEVVVRGLRELHRRTGIPLVATADVHYIHPDDAEAQEVLLCIQTQKTLDDPTRIQLRQYPLHFRPAAEMRAVFHDLPEALATTREIADRCRVELDFHTPHLPRFEPPAGKTADGYLREIVARGLARRYGTPVPAPAAARMEHELRVIREMSFSSYFLIVWDFIQFALRERIPVGPGRGSAAGSIVAYALEITALDPLRYDLLFERFLNPSRVSLPDIDIDFCTEGRERVIHYVREKYGAERVASIITIGTLAARAVLRDVGRVLRIPLAEVDRITKKIPAQPGVQLRELLAQDPELRVLSESTPVLRRLFDISQRLEGVARQAGTHAAGIVIADAPLAEYVPLYRRGDEISTQYTMDKLEDIGLLKMDFLGLKTLTLIDRALGEIERQHGTRPDLAALALDDQRTYALLAAGQAGGIFQVESEGMRQILVKLAPDRFEDLIAILALYRPGPLQSGMVDTFINRKHGREPVDYLHPALAPILAETHGVILYQEQVMRIANVLAGFDMADADALRKAMGKKKPEVMARFRSHFVDGGVARGIDAGRMEAIFTQMEYFAGYGFNKSHSAAYALITYQTAYLKANHPLAFTAALLSQDMTSTDKLIAHRAEAERAGIRILPPDVNRSAWHFVVDAGAIRYGLGGIKGLGDKATESLERARRTGGPFRSLCDITERTDVRLLNKTALEALIKAGALDELGPRGALLASVDEALQHGARVARDLRAGQQALFDAGASDLPAAPLPDVPDLDAAERLKGEKEALGFYLSGHPLESFRGVLARYATATIADLAARSDRAQVTVGGVFSSVAVQAIRSGPRAGQKMATAQFEDLTGRVTALLFPGAYERNAPRLAEDRPVFVRASVDRRRETPSLYVEEILPIEEGARTFGPRLLKIVVSRDRQTAEVFAKIRNVLVDYPGPADVHFVLTWDRATPPRQVRAGNAYRVRPADLNLIRELEMLVGAGQVRPA
ncbi:MAG: DNA polymerase III subunit alpha [Planctomycetes bacterium]|nr:DNA polymerase III subunit alpha [Planctomycetota bacterium]